MSVSVIIPTYNRAGSVVRAVESALNQTAPPMEVIVVDDGSTDATPEALRPFGDRIVYIRQENQGVSAARNAGIAASRGSLIAFLDSDDIWMPWKLELQLTCFASYPDLVLLGTGCTAIDETGFRSSKNFLNTYGGNRYLTESRMLSITEEVLVFAPSSLYCRNVNIRIGDLSVAMFMGNLFITSTAMFRKCVVNQVGTFDYGMNNAGEDYDFFWRLTEKGLSGLIDEPTILFRRGGSDQLHTARRQMALSNLAAIRKYLECHPDGPQLPRTLIAQRTIESYEWLGTAHFDEGYRGAARPYLLEALRRGSRSPRVLGYLMLTWLPACTTDVLRTVWVFLKAMTLAVMPRGRPG